MSADVPGNQPTGWLWLWLSCIEHLLWRKIPLFQTVSLTLSPTTWLQQQTTSSWLILRLLLLPVTHPLWGQKGKWMSFCISTTVQVPRQRWALCILLYWFLWCITEFPEWLILYSTRNFFSQYLGSVKKLTKYEGHISLLNTTVIKK